MWKCIERTHDIELAAINPDKLPPAIKIGVAPAMSANPSGPFWGGEEHQNMKFEQHILLGCLPEVRIPQEIRRTMCGLDSEMTAREYVQMFMAPEGWIEMQHPTRCEQQAPEGPNGYTDGSMLNPKRLHWSIGGL